MWRIFDRSKTMERNPPKVLGNIGNYFPKKDNDSEEEYDSARQGASTKQDIPCIKLEDDSSTSSSQSVKIIDDFNCPRSEKEQIVEILGTSEAKDVNDLSPRKRKMVAPKVCTSAKGKDAQFIRSGRNKVGHRSLIDEERENHTLSGLRKQRRPVNYNLENIIDDSLDAHSALLPRRDCFPRESKKKSSIDTNHADSPPVVAATDLWGRESFEKKHRTRGSIRVEGVESPQVFAPTDLSKNSPHGKNSLVRVDPILQSNLTSANAAAPSDVSLSMLSCSVTKVGKSNEKSRTNQVSRQYITMYDPYNIDNGEYAHWLRIGKEASEDAGTENWVEAVLDRKLKNGTPLYLVKYMGYAIVADGQQWWHSKEEITGSDKTERNKITDYEQREATMKKFAILLRKIHGKNFESKFPQYPNRKKFSSPKYRNAHSEYLDQLQRKECYITFLLEAHGQKPLYIANWTNVFELDDPSQFMMRPAEWTEESRRSLSFEYLLTVDAPQEILDEIAHRESLEDDQNLEFKCICDQTGQCLSRCPCVRRSKDVGLEAKIVGKDIIFDVDSENTIFFSCGSKCECGDYCHRKIPSWGRQYPMILFYHENKGWGVHAACQIPKGSFIGLYTGVLERMRPSEDAHYQFLFPTIFSNENADTVDSNDSSVDDALTDCLHYLVDSGVAGNEFSLINHSCNDGNVRAFNFSNCNNAVIYEIGFVATRNIKFGEELTYNYMLTDTKENSTNDSDNGNKPHVKCYCRDNCPNMVVA